jgi:hypothetical protein
MKPLSWQSLKFYASKSQKFEHKFSSCSLRFYVLFARACWIFSFHTLMFPVSVVVTEPQLISSNTVTWRGVISHMIPVQRAVKDVQMVTPIPFHELFWNPFYTNIMEVKSWGGEDDFIGRNVTNQDLVYHIIGSHRPVVKNWCADMLSVPFSCW